MSLRRAYHARLISQKYTQQGIVDFEMSIVIDEPQFTELVHEVAHARPGRADHLRECFLTDLRENWFGSAFLSKFANSSNNRAWAEIYFPN
jgi:hypothetical protein